MNQSGRCRADNDAPELITKEQTQEKRDANTANGEQQTFAEFLEVLEETHSRHTLFFVVLFVVRRLWGLGRGAGTTCCGRWRGGDHRSCRSGSCGSGGSRPGRRPVVGIRLALAGKGYL